MDNLNDLLKDMQSKRLVFIGIGRAFAVFEWLRILATTEPYPNNIKAELEAEITKVMRN